MSIFGTLLGLLGSGTAYGVANAKSKQQVRQMQDDYNRRFAKGCDPETEYRIACETYKKILNSEVRIQRELEQNIKDLHWRDLFKKYPEAVERENNSRRYFNEPLVTKNDEEAKGFIRFNFKHNVIQEEIKKEFLTDSERKDFSDDLQLHTLSEPNTFEKSVACVVAGREMCNKGFTPVGSAGSITQGGYYGYNSTKFQPAGFMVEVTCNPSEQEKRRALNAVGYIACDRRDGAATSCDGKTKEERRKEQLKQEENEEILKIFLVLGVVLAIIWGLVFIIKLIHYFEYGYWMD